MKYDVKMKRRYVIIFLEN